jgi:hypothetical protein
MRPVYPAGDLPGGHGDVAARYLPRLMRDFSQRGWEFNGGISTLRLKGEDRLK